MASTEQEQIKTIHLKEEALQRCEHAIKEVFAQCTAKELALLMSAFTEGRINGCRSKGKRCCLISTLAKIRGISHAQCLIQLNIGADTVREVEYWFFQICSLPSLVQYTENNYFVMLAHLWCEQMLFVKQPLGENKNSADCSYDNNISKDLMPLLRRLMFREKYLIPLLPPR